MVRHRAAVVMAYFLVFMGMVAISRRSQAQSLVTFIPLGDVRSTAGVPSPVAVNPVTNRLYLAVEDGLVVFDGATNTVIATPRVAQAQRYSAVNPATNTVYVLTFNGVAAIDGETNTVTSTIALPNLRSLDAIAVNPATNRVYVSSQRSESIAVIDGGTNIVVTTIAGVASKLAINPETNTIYGVRGDSVVAIDGATNAVTSTIAPAPPFAINGLAVNLETNTLYAAIASDTIASAANDGATPSPSTQAPASEPVNGAVAVIDGATRRVVTTVALGQRTPTSVAVNPVTNTVYVLSGTVLLGLDGATNKLVSLLSVEGSDVVVNPTTNRVYLTAGRQGLMAIDGAAIPPLSRTTSAIVATLPLDFIPGGVAVNEVTGVVYVRADRGPSGTAAAPLLVIDGATTMVTVAVPQLISPTAFAVNSATNTIYLGGILDRGEGVTAAILVIDGATHQVMATIPIPGGAATAGLAVNPTTSTVYATSGSLTAGFAVMAIDGATNSVVFTRPIDGVPSALAVNPATNTVFVGVQRYVRERDGAAFRPVGAGVRVIDGATNRTSAEVNFDGWVPEVAVNPRTNTVYVSTYVSTTESSLIVIDGETNRVATTLRVGYPLRGVAVDPVANLVYVTGGETVTVVDGATTTIRGFVTVGRFPFGIAVSTSTGTVYVSSPHGRSVTVIRPFRSAAGQAPAPVLGQRE